MVAEVVPVSFGAVFEKILFNGSKKSYSQKEGRPDGGPSLGRKIPA